jgi:hypothetical protein
MSSPSDTEVIGRSLGEPEAFELTRTYKALDLEGHRWRFHQRLREVPSPAPRSRSGEDQPAR